MSTDCIKNNRNDKNNIRIKEMEQRLEEKPLRAPNSPSLGRDTLYFPPSVEKEWKELSAKFKNVPCGVVRKNPEICDGVIRTVLGNTDLDRFIRKMSRADFEKILKSKVKKEIRPSLHEPRKGPIRAFEVQLPNAPDPIEKQKGCCHCCTIL